ncbi:MAG: VWA domain-containing protein [Bacteroidia bacterium]|nr:VWA domain-containing protein [Bacteroidia bacterium]
MFRFAHTEYLWALLVVVPLVFLAFWNLYQRNLRLKELGDPDLVKQLLGEFSEKGRTWKHILSISALVFAIFAVANPQIGSKYEEVKREGVELVVCLDVSNSMLAEDIQPNRLERSKQALSKLLDELGNDKIGLVVFAGDAYTQLPLTTDYGAAKLFLSSVGTDAVPVQGTAIGAAIEKAINCYGKNEAGNRAIIVISDGENHEDNALEQAKIAHEKGIKVHTIGMGSPQGAPIPNLVRGKMTGYKTDESGETVLSKMNESMLSEIASAGGGSYTRATNSDVGLNELLSQISKMEKKEIGKKMFTDFEDRFQYFLAVAVLLLLIELALPELKWSAWNKFKGNK